MARKRKINNISSPLNLQTITLFFYFRREVLSRYCGIARCAENKKGREAKAAYLFNISLYYLYAALSFFPLSAGGMRR